MSHLGATENTENTKNPVTVAAAAAAADESVREAPAKAPARRCYRCGAEPYIDETQIPVCMQCGAMWCC